MDENLNPILMIMHHLCTWEPSAANSENYHHYSIAADNYDATKYQ